VRAPDDIDEAEQRSDERGSSHLEGWDALRSRFSEFGVLGPLAVVLIGVGLDRAGYSAIGITITLLGGVVFIAMLYVLARWG
jgi:hypothetical protein